MEVDLLTKFNMKFLFKLLILIFTLSGLGQANEIKVFEFSKAELSQLEVRKVRGADNNTIYSVGSNENGNYLKAIADNAASGLGKKVKINLNKNFIFNLVSRSTTTDIKNSCS